MDLLGTCGGLIRVLTVFGGVLINPYTTYALNSHMAEKIVRLVPSDRAKPNLRR